MKSIIRMTAARVDDEIEALGGAQDLGQDGHEDRADEGALEAPEPAHDDHHQELDRPVERERAGVDVAEQRGEERARRCPRTRRRWRTPSACSCGGSLRAPRPASRSRGWRGMPVPTASRGSSRPRTPRPPPTRACRGSTRGRSGKRGCPRRGGRCPRSRRSLPVSDSQFRSTRNTMMLKPSVTIARKWCLTWSAGKPTRSPEAKASTAPSTRPSSNGTPALAENGHRVGSERHERAVRQRDLPGVARGSGSARWP